jgi:hypothetical protein
LDSNVRLDSKFLQQNAQCAILQILTDLIKISSFLLKYNNSKMKNNTFNGQVPPAKARPDIDIIGPGFKKLAA